MSNKETNRLSLVVRTDIVAALDFRVIKRNQYTLYRLLHLNSESFGGMVSANLKTLDNFHHFQTRKLSFNERDSGSFRLVSEIRTRSEPTIYLDTVWIVMNIFAQNICVTAVYF